MKQSTNWITNKIRMGWILLAAGALLGVAGLIAERQVTGSPYDLRIITGLGILLFGVGLANLVRYAPALKDAQSAKRLTSEERDERNVLIRQRAGHRAYWASALLIYALLMWVSFASNGSLPGLTVDTLWFALAGCVVLPFGVYIASVVIDQRSF